MTPLGGSEPALSSRQFLEVEPAKPAAVAGDVNPITFLSAGPIMLGRMLFLSAFARLIRGEPAPNDLLAQSRAALGHLGLTIIAIVFVLVTFWKS